MARRITHTVYPVLAVLYEIWQKDKRGAELSAVQYRCKQRGIKDNATIAGALIALHDRNVIYQHSGGFVEFVRGFSETCELLFTGPNPINPFGEGWRTDPGFYKREVLIAALAYRGDSVSLGNLERLTFLSEPTLKSCLYREIDSKPNTQMGYLAECGAVQVEDSPVWMRLTLVDPLIWINPESLRETVHAEKAALLKAQTASKAEEPKTMFEFVNKEPVEDFAPQETWIGALMGLDPGFKTPEKIAKKPEAPVQKTEAPKPGSLVERLQAEMAELDARRAHIQTQINAVFEVERAERALQEAREALNALTGAP